MYRSDGFLVPGVRVGRYHRLAEAFQRHGLSLLKP